MRVCLCFLGILFAFQVRASELFFPLQKNNVKVLPQRFEYQLIDKDKIRIGDITLDASRIDFQMVPIKDSPGQFKMRFRWPSGFLKDGELVVKDSAGKAVMIKPIQRDQILKMKASENDNARESMATYEITEEVPELLAKLEKAPFFKFCVHREETFTKIYLCSKDLYFKKQGRGRVQVLTRDSFRPESYVEINGRTVGPQGIIFLNDPSEFIALRTLLLSGATLELDTRVKSVEFKDVTLSDDGQNLVVRASGAEPVDESLVQRLADNEWQVQLDATRPFVYLKGEGDLPLRQEFLIQGPVRNPDTKVSVTNINGRSEPTPLKTYSESIRFLLKPSKNTSLERADRLSQLDKQDNNNYQWTMESLKKNQNNRRYVKVLDKGNTFYAGYDIFRASGNIAYLRLMYPFWTEAGVEHWLNTRWALQFQFDQQITKTASEAKLRSYELRMKYRTPAGIVSRDPYFGILGFARNQSVNSESFNVLGLGLSAETPSLLFKNYFQTMNFELLLPLSVLNSDFKVTSSYEGRINFRHSVHEALYYEFGASFNSLVVSSAINGVTAETSSRKAYLIGGLGWLF